MHHTVTEIVITDEHFGLKIDGEFRRFSLAEVSSRLATATDDERQHFEISPGGYGIHWPLLDEDIAIDGLLGIEHSPDSQLRSA